MSEREERRLIRRLAEELATTPRPYPPYARDLLVTEATDYLARPDRVAEVVAAARMHFKLGTLTCNCSVCVAVALLDAAEREAGNG